MATTAAIPDQQARTRVKTTWVVVLAMGAGLLVRLRLAWLTFLNPDEALHYFLSHQPSPKLAYRASLTTAHPPLMVLFLQSWSRLGNSEFFLRLPFVIAGVLFCWVMFLWVEKVWNRNTALLTLILFLFSPSLISLSAEIRQYSFLLLFCAGCLYFLERALEENSFAWMAFAAVALCFALLTHYSALVFAAAAGIYGLLCWFRTKPRAAVISVWIAGQIGAVAICIFLFRSHISRLRQSGVPSEIAGTWLRSSIFHRGEDHFAVFAWTKTVRLFRYFFSHGTIGFLSLGLFLFAIALLLWPRDRKITKLRARELALLVLSPLLITLGTALAGVYPYGGTRHDVLLALFVMPGIAIGLDSLPTGRLLWSWFNPLVLLATLLICNLFPSPSGPYIRPQNQNKKLMTEAVGFLRSTPANSVLFADMQGSLVLSYYLCDKRTELPFEPPSKSLLMTRCGDHYILTSARTQQTFDRAIFPTLLADAWRKAPAEATLYVFQSGWIDDKEEDWLSELRRLGGEPRNYGPNVLLCPISRAGRSGSH